MTTVLTSREGEGESPRVTSGGGEVDLETEGWNRKISSPDNLVECLG